MLKKRRVTIDISVASIFWILTVILSLFFVSSIYTILILLFTALIITFSVDPIIQKLESKKIPRALSSVIVLTTLFASIGFIISSIISPIIDQTTQLIEKLPDFVNKILPYKLNFSDFSSQLSIIPGKFVNIAVDTVSVVISGIAVIVLSYYLLQERKRLKENLQFWFTEKAEAYYSMVTDIETQIGHWFRGELFLMLVIGLLAYLGYLIIGNPYALPLALIAGLLEIVPNIGPLVATILAAIVGFSVSPTMGIGAVIVNVIIQQLENNLITPVIMKKAAGLNPIITIIAIMIGLKIGGPMLSILAIPLVLFIKVALTHLKINKTTNIPEIH
ncbi:MAG TPA: AI-2E family transporter [Candidatus Woesebacteria bacterium]|nr:AI-2E family transporter [Candidatus Woesebacteria bacterium]